METARNALRVLLEKRQLFPHLLSQTYPHVLARILEAWESPGAIDACFQDLMFAEPRRKQGFPEDVMIEIFYLAKFHDSIYPRVASSPTDIWSRSLKFSNANYVRSMQSRWGSLSQAGTMTLNANLVRAPRGCI